jgi:DNA polymerase elongation subunit (family B)
MIDSDIVGMGWMKINKYRVIRTEHEFDTEKSKEKTPTIAPMCQLEIECDCHDIVSMSTEMKMPPLRILSFDIECAA